MSEFNKRNFSWYQIPTNNKDIIKFISLKGRLANIFSHELPKLKEVLSNDVISMPMAVELLTGISTKSIAKYALEVEEIKGSCSTALHLNRRSQNLDRLFLFR